MKANGAAQKAVEEVRRLLAASTDDERTTYEAFSELIGSEVEGWEMRLDELDSEDDDEDVLDDDEDDWEDDEDDLDDEDDDEEDDDEDE